MGLGISIKTLQIMLKSPAVLRQLEVILKSSKCLHLNLWRSPCNQCRCAVTTTAFMVTWFLPSLDRTWLDHPKMLLREESGRGTDSVWVLINQNQTYLASLLAVLVQVSFVQIKSWWRSVSTAQPLLSHSSAVQHQEPEGHRQQDRETVQSYPMSPPWQCHLWLPTVFWLNWSFCTASIREDCTKLVPALVWVCLEHSSVTDTGRSIFEHSHT